VYFMVLLLLGLFSLQEMPVEKEEYAIMYFYNPDCPACKEIAPFIDYLKEEYEAVIYSYNTRNPVGFRYGMQHQIRYVPTMIIMVEREGEKEEKRFEGIEQIKNAESEIALISNSKEPAAIDNE